MKSGKSKGEVEFQERTPGILGAVREHLLPRGRLEGLEPSETVWTGCDGPAPDSWTTRRVMAIGIFSWILVAVLAVWLHMTRLDGFLDAFPLVLGAKILVFLWVLFGVSVLRPVFVRRSRTAKEPSREA